MEERIQQLFRKYLSNTCSREEFDELFLLLQNRDNDVILGDSIGAAYEEQLNAAPRIRKRKPALAIAAAILILLIAGTMLFWLPRRAERTMAITDIRNMPITVRKATERSEYKYLLLPDSTQVWLNAESTLEFPETFDAKKREVRLKGEAYFDVRHADRIPFIIYTGSVSTEVLGTAFNIKAYDDLEKITVSVKRGKVRVKYDREEVAMLTMGQQVVIDQKVKKVKEREIKTEESSAWQDGNLVYDDYSVGDILSDLERIYDVRIRTTSPETGNIRISTSFRREQGIENALEVLCRLTDSRLTVDKGMYNIMK